MTMVPLLTCCSSSQAVPDYRVGDAFLEDARGLPYYAPVKISLNRLDRGQGLKLPVQRGVVVYALGRRPVVIDLDQLEVWMTASGTRRNATAPTPISPPVALTKLEAASLIQQANAIWSNPVVCRREPIIMDGYGPSAEIVDHEYHLSVTLDCIDAPPEITALKQTLAVLVGRAEEDARY